MRLDDARLCLDCEEIHEAHECPACGSEAFAFLTRWIHSTTRDNGGQARPSRRHAPIVHDSTPATSRPKANRDELEAWRRIVAGEPPPGGTGRKVLTRGLMGLAAAGVAGWIWSRGGSKEEEG